MRKLFSLFLALVATTSLWAGDFTVDGIYYSYIYGNKVEVTFRGYISSSYDNEYSGEVIIPSTVTLNGTTYSVTSIGDGAFRNCSSLTSVTIPNSVTSIGDGAFSGCSSLTSVTIPYSVTSIGDYAFQGCSSLTSVTIPNSVTSIGDYAFCYCSALTSVTIPNSVTSIGDWAFCDCSSLTSITIGNSVTSIGNYAFYDCSSLTSVTINSDAIVNKQYSLDSNLSHIFGSQVTEYVIGDDVKGIGDCTFYKCSKLTSVTIGNSVTSIGKSAFSQCASLTSITIPNSVTSIGISAFNGCSSLTSITIPNSVTSIGNSVFHNCFSLTSITIPNSITSIGNYAFYDCSSLTSVTIPNSVTNIGEMAFYNCTSLISITIPNSVTSIVNRAFYNCTSLASITCEATTPPTLGSSVFYGVSKSIPVYVPCGCVKAYKAKSGWNDFTNIQEPLAEYSIEVNVNDATGGTAKVDRNSACGNQISATPNFGYHFVQWSDGATDNPRTLVLTQDTILTAEFAINQYTISIASSHKERGTTAGDTVVDYLEYVTISATANYGYHFTQWNDKNTSNPRQVQVTEDKTYTAYFDKNTYYITKNYDSNQGYINGSSSGEYLDNITLTAEANYGYHFVQWSDGVTDNPRSLILTQDTTFTAEFAPNQYTVTTLASHSERGTTQGDTTVNYLNSITITAAANYGYHFTQWNDGNTENPRSLVLTQDTTLTAEFAINTYTLTTKSNGNGNVTGNGTYKHGENVIISATADIGYHFVRWNDGNTDNPRTLELTQDTILTAEFAANKYLISTVSNDPKRGTTSGDTLAAYLDYVTISATAKYGYHFSSWENGNADNPRLVQVTGNKEYMAYFDKNTYTVTTSCDGSYGTVSPSVTGEYLDTVTLTATPTLGYHFSRWSDGNTDNPRSFVLTQDTTFSAEFTQSFSGQCGDDLYWAYNESVQSIAITGTGDMYNYTSGTQPWVLFLEKIKKVTTDNTAASLGTSAFEGAIRLAEVHIGAKIDMIEANVFAGCDRLRNIYCYPTYPPIIRESSFARYDALLYIPCDYLDDYVFDRNWKKFENIQCAGAEEEEVESDEVEVDPSSTSVTMTWPTEENAYTYTIEIHKDGALFCRLVFNTTGQLLNISFAPSRDGNNRPAQYAELVANGSGMRFTVTGLNESTHYTYDLKAKDKDENTIQSHSGEFTTKSNVTTDMNNIQSPVTTCQKLLRNGQLIILRDGVEYNAMGAEIQ